MRIIILVLFVLLVGGVALFFNGRRVETYRDQRIEAGELRRPLGDLAVHVSKTQYLSINGRTYTKVRGLKPYYLDIPELDSILFVTDSKDKKVLFHIVNLRTANEISIDGGTSGFGWAIGSGRKRGENGADYIDDVQSNRLTIAKRSLNWKETWVLNLDSRRVDKHEVYIYDKDGNITNQSSSNSQNAKE